ncbi:DHA2 family efflux MFS transporter permease subunit [Paracraurococcus ruber]|uniref:Major facilitator superfamily (MFS) profile domain-containing protein n=1 Tax=Paracraurococcus ruber TaxID=77675 RepID=A0ABS1CUM7_9PROT|nr:DHA2 family efflux MFS transporter permease subunit [Paracraurococcus ruber]MBK1657707.1 hypothetical protein [Paracraurococcus ruber]TDG31552.1 DHA2 family efflux MFS transporter permease subunit [Paracraurococcus ruber]
MSAATATQGGIFSIGGRLWLILLMVQLANLLFGMTITLANLVLPEVRGAVSATQDEISWVITLNLAATAVATPMTGWLAGRLGWRALMFGTITGFTLASLACGLATSLDQLILARVAQGAFGAPIMPLGQAILLTTFPKHLQSTALVMWGVGAVFGPVLGPILGAIATEAWNWRAAFLMIVPCGVACMTCTWFALRDHTRRDATALDWVGFLALSVALVAAQLVLDRGQRLDWFESPEILLCSLLGLLAFWVFVAHSLTAAHPFLDPRLLLDRNFSIGLVISLVMGMLAFTSMTLVPSLLHDLRGYPHDAIGLLIAARGMGNWLAFLVVIPFTRVAPRLAIATGLALQAASAFWMASFDINLTEDGIFWSHMLQGFGQSIAFTPLAMMAFATLPPRQVAEGSAVFTLMRNFGSSLFISLAVLVLIRTTSMNYAQMTALVSPFNEILVLPGMPSQWELGSTSGLLRLANEIQRQASMIGYVNAFLLMAATAALAVPLAGLMRGAQRAG